MVNVKAVLVALFRRVNVRVFPAPGDTVSCAYKRNTVRGIENGNCARDSLAIVWTVPNPIMLLFAKLATEFKKAEGTGANPVGPVAPVSPVAPADPVAPVAPVAPVLPVAPVAPVFPVAPVLPVAPVVPVEPVLPVAPVAPVAPVLLAVPGGPVAPVAPSIPI